MWGVNVDRRWLALHVFERDQYMCCICGTDERLTLDRIIPGQAGGTYDVPWNVRTLCFPHNRGRGSVLKDIDIDVSEVLMRAYATTLRHCITDAQFQQLQRDFKDVRALKARRLAEHLRSWA